MSAAAVAALRAIAMGGACSGEHGIGFHKLGLTPAQHGDEALGVMRTIEAAPDPLGIMKPGKTAPPHAAAAPGSVMDFATASGLAA